MTEDEILKKLNTMNTIREKAEFLRYELGMPDAVALAHLRLMDVRERIENENAFQTTVYMNISDPEDVEDAKNKYKTMVSFLEKGSLLMSEYASCMMQLAQAVKNSMEED